VHTLRTLEDFKDANELFHEFCANVLASSFANTRGKGTSVVMKCLEVVRDIGLKFISLDDGNKVC
jgi:L-rhamnose isomerase